MQPYRGSRKKLDTHIYIYTHIHTFTHTYIYIYIYIHTPVGHEIRLKLLGLHPLQEGYSERVSICTFVPVKQVN
jgi:hypothetical protein